MLRIITSGLLITGCAFSLFVFGSAMGLFGKKITVYPFSGFSGQLLHEGEPAAYAKVTREWDWDGTKHEEVTSADKDGYFSFEPVRVETRESLSEFVSSQRVTVNFKMEDYSIWVCSKRDKGIYGEFGSEPVNLKCELTQELFDVDLIKGLAVSNCTWDKE